MLRHSFAPPPCTSGKLAGAERIEHPLVVLETTVLPLNYTPTLAGTLGVEPRHTESKSDALPLRYAPITGDINPLAQGYFLTISIHELSTFPNLRACY